MKQANNFFLLVLALACSLLPIYASAEKLGPVKVFKTRTGNPKVELTLVRLGERKEMRVLAYFKTPDFEIDGEYNIYEGRCQTKKCKTIIYNVIGGTQRNFVSKSGYFGDYFELLLPGRKNPLSVYYDEKISSSIANDAIYNKYLASAGRYKSGSYNVDAVTKSFTDSLKELQLACKSTVTINKNIDAFRNNKIVHVVGMGEYYIKEIASRCADTDYREELAKIRTISFLPVSSRTPIVIKGSELFIYLSERTYNPVYEAKFWLENL